MTPHVKTTIDNMNIQYIFYLALHTDQNHWMTDPSYALVVREHPLLGCVQMVALFSYNFLFPFSLKPVALWSVQTIQRSIILKTPVMIRLTLQHLEMTLSRQKKLGECDPLKSYNTRRCIYSPNISTNAFLIPTTCKAREEEEESTWIRWQREMDSNGCNWDICATPISIPPHHPISPRIAW